VSIDCIVPVHIALMMLFKELHRDIATHATVGAAAVDFDGTDPDALARRFGHIAT